MYYLYDTPYNGSVFLSLEGQLISEFPAQYCIPSECKNFVCTRCYLQHSKSRGIKNNVYFPVEQYFQTI